MMKKLALGIAGLALLVAVGVAIYLLQLTAPVDVADTPPAPPTLDRSVVSSVESPTTASSAAADASGSGTASRPESTQPAENAAGTEIAATPVPTQGSGERGSSASAPKAPPARIFRIDPDRSVASYSVGEVFLEDNQFNTAVGKTNAVGGEILVNADNPAASRVGEIVIDISQLKSDSERRDNAICRRWLESAKYPRATFTNARLSGLPKRVVQGKQFSFSMTGNMTIREVTRPQKWNVVATLDGDTLKGKATTRLKMTQYGVDPPDIAGFVKAEDDVALTLEFVANAVR